MKRQNSIDFIKIFFAIVVVLFHFETFFIAGYLAVEGFFMISGFLMIRSINKNSEEIRTSKDSTARFVFHKYSAIFLPLLFSAIFGFIIYEIFIFKKPVNLLLRSIPRLLYEVFPLQVAGMDAYYSTGVSWYLSSLFLSIAILHSFAKRDPEKFAYTACPVIALLGYSLICVNCKMLDVASIWLFGNIINTGLIRGLAGISLGCILYYLVERESKKQEPTKQARIFYTFITIACIAAFIYFTTTPGVARTTSDFICLAPLFLLLYIELSGKSLFKYITNYKWTHVLSTASLYIYMNHFAWRMFFDTNYAGYDRITLLPWYLLCVALSSSAVCLLTYVTRKIIRVIKNKYSVKEAEN